MIPSFLLDVRSIYCAKRVHRRYHTEGVRTGNGDDMNRSSLHYASITVSSLFLTPSGGGKLGMMIYCRPSTAAFFQARNLSGPSSCSKGIFPFGVLYLFDPISLYSM